MKDLRNIVFSSSTNSASEIAKNSRFNIDPIKFSSIAIEVLNGNGLNAISIANRISNKIKNAIISNAIISSDYIEELILINESNTPIITVDKQYILIKL